MIFLHSLSAKLVYNYSHQFCLLFNIGITTADFQILGYMFCWMEILKSMLNGLAIVWQVFFNILWLIPSGPLALLTISELNIS